MLVLLVRHAHYPGVGRVLAGHTPGLGLDAEGQAQAERLAAAIGPGLDDVVSSPLDRAEQTAAAIAAAAGVTLRIDPGWTEIAFGPWTGRDFASLADDPDWARWNHARGLAAPPGVEPMLDVQQRTAAALRALAASGLERVAVVSHADVIRAAASWVLGAPLDLMHRLALAPAHRAALSLWPGGAELLGWNLPP